MVEKGKDLIKTMISKAKKTEIYSIMLYLRLTMMNYETITLEKIYFEGFFQYPADFDLE